jgi:hypothetical protein
MKTSLITLVQSKGLVAAMAGVPNLTVVDFQLAMDEAVRILGIEGTIRSVEAQSGTWGNAQMAVSFDPNDNAIDDYDDEQFCMFVASFDIVGVTGGMTPGLSEFRDYTGMNLLTVRNLGLILTAENSVPYIGCVKVCYEKFKPTQAELVQLIARRR